MPLLRAMTTLLFRDCLKAEKEGHRSHDFCSLIESADAGCSLSNLVLQDLISPKRLLEMSYDSRRFLGLATGELYGRSLYRRFRLYRAGLQAEERMLDSKCLTAL